MPPTHVVLFKYNPTTKDHTRYDALVIGSTKRDEHDQPLLNVVYFKHDEPKTHHALAGVGWSDTLERMLDVPHKSDLGAQAFYYLHAGEAAPVPLEMPGDEQQAPGPVAVESNQEEADEEADEQEATSTRSHPKKRKHA